MRTFLIIVPNGGMLFEAAGIADILMQANRLRSKDSQKQLYKVTIATTHPHRVVQGLSGLNLLADDRLSDLDPELERDTIMITGRGMTEEEGESGRFGLGPAFLDRDPMEEGRSS